MIFQADRFLLLWANAWAAQSPARFYRLLQQSETLAWLIGALFLTMIWFYGERGVIASPGHISRLEARRRMLLGLAAMMAGFLTARLIQHFVPRLRPLATEALQVPIDNTTWDLVQQGLELQGSFPSDHAVMLFSLAVLAWNILRRLGLPVLLYALYFSFIRIAIGYHWPSDILAGMVLAWALTWLALRARRPLEPLLSWVVLQFEIHPRWAYGLGFLFLYDFTQKFSSLFALLKHIAAFFSRSAS